MSFVLNLYICLKNKSISDNNVATYNAVVCELT